VNRAAVSTHLPEETIAPAHRLPAKEMVWIPGGTFQTKADYFSEAVLGDRVTVSGFWMDRYPVTNAGFQAFVDATGYVPVAERASASERYAGILPGLSRPTALAGRPPWEADSCNCWQMPSASWRYPEGAASSIEGREHHPVVQIAYEDVEAYAQWVGKEIPTEAEWEFAAWGGWQETETDGAEEKRETAAPSRSSVCPIDAGRTAIAGQYTTPVGCYPANRYGLYDMLGNVWEWTADWYCDHPLLIGPCINPAGGTIEQSYDPALPETPTPRKVLKGGCCRMVDGCFRRSPATRIAQPIDVSTCHTGFRLIRRSPLQEG
jgi:formylglycine-generating enzyme